MLSFASKWLVCVLNGQLCVELSTSFIAAGIIDVVVCRNYSGFNRTARSL